MKKRGLLFINIAFIFLLTACSEEVIQYEAKATDFEESGFKNKYSQIISIHDEELLIFTTYDHTEKKTSIDKIFELEDSTEKPLQKIYKNVKIKTKKDRYYITAEDGLSLEFRKIGERIIVDEEGVEYYTSKYPE
ncbi:hypothetical protein [Psychrobacillus psychrodurans]|uniref:hypothetical protein n=2 Tax=Psychrobacillus psychrodurans TaxID=126157 RepID=UPI0008E96D50|nr:hypothetical protein [Psychrobacillus psychrodurans]MCZ8541890.1 hypothetical protein [Psychrobacillus psychrodurans]SFN10966.1 hypothetical protein SAMN05421832_11519 [Psychrobacillus psychrodurans]